MYEWFSLFVWSLIRVEFELLRYSFKKIRSSLSLSVSAIIRDYCQWRPSTRSNLAQTNFPLPWIYKSDYFGFRFSMDGPFLTDPMQNTSLEVWALKQLIHLAHQTSLPNAIQTLQTVDLVRNLYRCPFFPAPFNDAVLLCSSSSCTFSSGH